MKCSDCFGDGVEKHAVAWLLLQLRRTGDDGGHDARKFVNGYDFGDVGISCQ